MCIICLVVGGVLTYFVLPERVKIEEKEVLKYVEVAKKTEKITKPDGTVIEKTEENSKAKEENNSKNIEIVNQRRFKIFGGYNVAKPLEKEWTLGSLYKIWGPLNIGIEANSKGQVYGLVGIEF